jgi:hypothetical protein
MASPADAVRLYLVRTGVAIPASQTPATGQWPITTGDLPTDPDNCLAVQDSGGFVRGRIQRDGRTVVFPNVIIVIRSVPYANGMNKGRQIMALFEKIGLPADRGGVGEVSVTVESQTWVIHAAHLTVPTTKIGQEEKNRRQLFTINYRLSLQAPAASLSGLTF